MENYSQEFYKKLEEVTKKFRNGLENLVTEMDGAMFQFIVEEKATLGKEWTQRAFTENKGSLHEMNDGDKGSNKAYARED